MDECKQRKQESAVVAASCRITARNNKGPSRLSFRVLRTCTGNNGRFLFRLVLCVGGPQRNSSSQVDGSLSQEHDMLVLICRARYSCTGLVRDQRDNCLTRDCTEVVHIPHTHLIDPSIHFSLPPSSSPVHLGYPLSLSPQDGRQR